MILAMFLLCLSVQKHHPAIRTLPAQYKQPVFRGVLLNYTPFYLKLYLYIAQNNSNHTLNN